MSGLSPVLVLDGQATICLRGGRYLGHKGAVAFGHSGDEIVVRRLIP